jgi:hypothetical protein
MLSLILLLAVAIAREAIQALDRVATLTRDDFSAAESKPHEPPAHLTTPLLL